MARKTKIRNIQSGQKYKYNGKFIIVIAVNRFWNSDGKLLHGVVIINTRAEPIDIHTFHHRAIRDWGLGEFRRRNEK